MRNSRPRTDGGESAVADDPVAEYPPVVTAATGLSALTDLFNELVNTGRAARDGRVASCGANSMARTVNAGVALLRFQARNGLLAVPPLPPGAAPCAPPAPPPVQPPPQTIDSLVVSVPKKRRKRSTT